MAAPSSFHSHASLPSPSVSLLLPPSLLPGLLSNLVAWFLFSTPIDYIRGSPPEKGKSDPAVSFLRPYPEKVLGAQEHGQGGNREMGTDFLFSPNSNDFGALVVWPKVPHLFGRAGICGVSGTTHLPGWKPRLSAAPCSALPPSRLPAGSQVEPGGTRGKVLPLRKACGRIRP